MDRRDPTSDANTTITVPGADVDALRGPFRDLHGSRLHGFALLVALGDRRLAARVAGDALAAGAQRVADLRHPERAAAWLRAEVMRRLNLPSGLPVAHPSERREALAELGLGQAGQAGLSALTPQERAAFVATVVEQLEPLDVATVIGEDGDDLAATLTRARRRYSVAFAVASAEADPPPPGPLAERVSEAAARQP